MRRWRRSSVAGLLEIRRLPAVLVAALSCTAFLASCEGGATPKTASGRASTTAVFPSYTASATQPNVDVHSSPAGPTTVTLSSPLPEGTPLTFLLAPLDTQAGGAWVKVLLPTKPNGSTGWVPGSEVEIHGDPYQLVVELSRHRLSTYNFGALQHTYPIAVGAADTPTPLGSYYLTELLKPTNAGLYGDYAYGLSGHSAALQSFDGYDAEIGLHGTGDPSSIGQSVTHGCIRLNNSDIDALVPSLPLGTPVDIRP